MEQMASRPFSQVCVELEKGGAGNYYIFLIIIIIVHTLLSDPKRTEIKERWS